MTTHVLTKTNSDLLSLGVEEHYNLEELTAIYKPKENEDGELITPICTDEPLSIMSFQLEKKWRLVSDFRFERIYRKVECTFS